MKNFHHFHLVSPRPWPILARIIFLNFFFSVPLWILIKNNFLFITRLIFLLIRSYIWWKDISDESIFEGLHTRIVKKGLKIGIMLFIISEIIFFFSFFWSFFHYSLTPSEYLFSFPPIYVDPFNPLVIPLLNTLILLSSGVSVTLAHHFIIINNFLITKKFLILSIIFGILFSILQRIEYKIRNFLFRRSVYSRIFFLTTGFHGLHVLIGTIFLFIVYLFLKNFSSWNHLRIEFSIWYWHFVDLVWLFLYSFLYW